MGGINQEGNRNRPSYIGLGHEMAHIKDIWQGTVDNGEWTQGISNAEKYATHVENQLRSEHGIPLRTHYSIMDNGKGDPNTSLLIKGTNSSLYIKKRILNGSKMISVPYEY